MSAEKVELDWGPEDRFRSNGGRGPLRARILCVCDGIARAEYWDERKPNGRRTRFEVSERVFIQPKPHGWTRIPGTASP